jgi:hypothetical protein
LVTKVNMLGKIDDDPAVLSTVADGDTIRVEAAD